MEDQRFDDLVKRLSTTRLTRMSVLRGLAAGAVATVAGTASGSNRSAVAQDERCQLPGETCEGASQKCCPGTICNPAGGPSTRCVSCGAPGEFCCTGTTPCQGQNNVCLPSGTCG